MKWIRKSERLPEWNNSEVGKPCFVTVEGEDGKRSVMIADFYAACRECHAVFGDEFGELEGVIAWAEVEPYKGEA